MSINKRTNRKKSASNHAKRSRTVQHRGQRHASGTAAAESRKWLTYVATRVAKCGVGSMSRVGRKANGIEPAKQEVSNYRTLKKSLRRQRFSFTRLNMTNACELGDVCCSMASQIQVLSYLFFFLSVRDECVCMTHQVFFHLLFERLLRPGGLVTPSVG